MKKITFKSFLLSVCVLHSFITFSQTTIVANNDSYIWNSQSNINYGSSKLIISNDTDNSSHIREVYLKFPIASLNNVNLAIVKLTLESTIATTRSYEAYLVDNENTWSNNFIKWNNAPSATGAAIASGVHVGNTVEFDITDKLKTYVENSEVLISIKIVSTEEDVASHFYSTDTATLESQKPSLIVSETTLSIGDNADSGIDKAFVYYNPTTTSVYIGGLMNKQTMISVYNALGKLMKHEEYNAKIDMTTLNTGLYYIKVTNDLEQKTFRIIKK